MRVPTPALGGGPGWPPRSRGQSPALRVGGGRRQQRARADTPCDRAAWPLGTPAPASFLGPCRPRPGCGWEAGRLRPPSPRGANRGACCSVGMKDGQKILFHGEGDQEPELEPGDVIIVLDQKDHSVFQRRGHDLIMKMKIQLSEALCGFKKTIKTLDDRTLVITSKSGEARAPRAPSPAPGHRSIRSSLFSPRTKQPVSAGRGRGGSLGSRRFELNLPIKLVKKCVFEPNS